MLSARKGQERLLLELAFELEAAAPFAPHRRRSRLISPAPPSP
ncbi:hypothetical protein LP422_24265 [Janibacter limosus]|nr:hypothetical protein LP422_24265 [Janibacter limosus]